jgi:WD40 repeat protein
MTTDTRLRSAAFDSQRRQLAIGTNYQAIVLDVEQLEATARLIHDRVLQSPEPVLSMDWTKDDTILLTATDDQLRAWLVADESELRRQPMETKPRAILATGNDRTAWVIAGRQLLRWNWDERTLKPVKTLHDDVLCLSVSDDHERLLTGTQDGLVQLWNRNDLQNAVQSYRHDHPVTAVRFLDKRNLIATGTHAGGVRFWNQQTGQRVGPVYHHDRSVQNIDASDDQQQVLTGSTDRTARIWRLPQTQRRRCLAAWTDQLESATELSIDPQGNISRKTALVVE